MNDQQIGFGRFLTRTSEPHHQHPPTSGTTIRRCAPGDGLASLPDKSVDLVVTTPHGMPRAELLRLLDLAAAKTRKYIICAWPPRNLPSPPVGWHEAAIHVWDKRDPRAEHPFEMLTVWSRDPEPMPCLLFSASAPEAVRTWEVHPSSKPASVLRQLLFTYSRAGDIVVDPFHGTGSVSRACERLKRTYLGFSAQVGSRPLQATTDDLVVAEERVHEE